MPSSASGGDGIELREFVYLDTLSVNSLLASLGEPIVEETQAVDEAIDESDRGVEVDVEAEAGGRFGEILNSVVANLGATGGFDLSKSETARELLKITSRINEQGRFDRLHNALRDNITELPPEKSSGDTVMISEDMDVVKITGMARADPIYRLLNALRLMETALGPHGTGEFGDNHDSDLEDFLSVYGDEIPVILELQDDNDYPYVILLQKENIWGDEVREFISESKYTVVGRMKDVIPKNQKWDNISFLRISNTVFSEGFTGLLRNSVVSVAEELSDTGLQDLDEDLEEILDDEEEPNWSRVNPDVRPHYKNIYEQGLLKIDPSELTIDGPVIVIDPIAIYW